MTARLGRHRATFVAGLLALLAAVATISVGSVLTRRISVVETHGASMSQRYHDGDLVVLVKASNYRVGEVAAYRIPGRDTIVLHRIVAADAAGFTFKGDDNTSPDPAHPGRAQLVGRPVLRIPGGGIWLHRLPALLAISLSLALLLAGNRASRRRRHNRRTTMSRPYAHQISNALRSLSPRLGAATAVVGVTAGLGLLLAGLAWTAPAHHLVTVATVHRRQVAFSYSAVVTPSAAYDTTHVMSPDPIFRSVARAVTVDVAYTGPAATMSIAAQLSTSSGWRSTMQLAPTTPVPAGRHTRTITLDLASLQARARAAGLATGLASDQVGIAVRPTIRTPGRSPLAPTMRLTMTPQVLSLAEQPAALRVSDATTTSRRVSRATDIVIASHRISAERARLIAALILLASAVAATVILLAYNKQRRLGEGAAIRRRFGQLLVVVEPITTKPGRPLVDVTEMATLAKLAERYGLLILCWTRSGVETFLVQDETTTYRYRVASAPLEDRELAAASSHNP